MKFCQGGLPGNEPIKAVEGGCFLIPYEDLSQAESLLVTGYPLDRTGLVRYAGSGLRGMMG